MHVELVEVSPRDGLQNEDRLVTTETKRQLVVRCIEAGARRIEAVSFVHPDRVPQMADAEQLMDVVPRRDDVAYAGLVLNERGLDRALSAGVDEVNFVVVATDTFGVRNQGQTTAEAIGTWGRMSDRARGAGLRSTVTIAASFGCPFEGEVAVSRVVDVVRRITSIGVDEVALADTIGVGTPAHVSELLKAVREVTDVRLRCHFHNTRNTGVANAYAAALAGPVALDVSLAGIGGCPFAPAATGNVPTEDIAYMFERMGVPTGLDLRALVRDAPWLGERLAATPPGLLSRAGLFPPDASGGGGEAT